MSEGQDIYQHLHYSSLDINVCIILYASEINFKIITFWIEF